MRVKIIKEFVLENFSSTPLLNYALEVEKITTSKKPNLILNVDGVIAVSFVDMLRNSGSFTREEAQEYIDMGSINSLFVLGRSIGFIGRVFVVVQVADIDFFALWLFQDTTWIKRG
jgi:ATP citrate (pro-S)-lyase